MGYDKADDYNPQGPASGSNRVKRGGSWNNNAVIQAPSTIGRLLEFDETMEALAILFYSVGFLQE